MVRLALREAKHQDEGKRAGGLLGETVRLPGRPTHAGQKGAAEARRYTVYIYTCGLTAGQWAWEPAGARPSTRCSPGPAIRRPDAARRRPPEPSDDSALVTRPCLTSQTLLSSSPLPVSISPAALQAHAAPSQRHHPLPKMGSSDLSQICVCLCHILSIFSALCPRE